MAGNGGVEGRAEVNKKLYILTGGESCNWGGGWGDSHNLLNRKVSHCGSLHNVNNHRVELCTGYERLDDGTSRSSQGELLVSFFFFFHLLTSLKLGCVFQTMAS